MKSESRVTDLQLHFSSHFSWNYHSSLTKNSNFKVSYTSYVIIISKSNSLLIILVAPLILVLNWLDVLKSRYYVIVSWRFELFVFLILIVVMHWLLFINDDYNVSCDSYCSSGFHYKSNWTFMPFYKVKQYFFFFFKLK